MKTCIFGLSTIPRTSAVLLIGMSIADEQPNRSLDGLNSMGAKLGPFEKPRILAIRSEPQKRECLGSAQ